MKNIIRKIKKKLLHKPIYKKVNHVSYWINKVLPNDDCFIVQIGSNDGKTGDPLYALFKKNRKWRGLFVEPVEYLFKKLADNYNYDSRFVFEKAAISEGKNLIFYSVDPIAKAEFSDLPFWYDQLGSFDRDHITKHLDGKLIKYIVEEEVTCLSLDELFLKYKIDQISLIHIDVEGHDWKVLSQLDLERFQPKIIIFEYHHLQESEYHAAVNFLNHDYSLFKFGIDIFAVHKSVNPKAYERIEQLSGVAESVNE